MFYYIQYQTDKIGSVVIIRQNNKHIVLISSGGQSASVPVTPITAIRHHLYDNSIS